MSEKIDLKSAMDKARAALLEAVENAHDAPVPEIRAQWTTTPPTAPGFYWARVHPKSGFDLFDGGEIACVCVYRRTDWQGHDEGLYLAVPEWEVPEPSRKWGDMFDLWAGPVAPPELPPLPEGTEDGK